MGICEEILKENDYDINFSAEVILLIYDKKTEIEIGVYPSGKLLFKTINEDKIHDAIDRIEPIVQKVVE